MASLIDQFNESVNYYDAQTDADWQDRAMKALAKKFKLLARGAGTDEETNELVQGMTAFMADYIDRDFAGKPSHEGIDAVSQQIDMLGEALFAAAKPDSFPTGSAKQFNLLAAKLVGLSEEADDSDCYDAFQDQADKVSEIADGIQKLEVAPPPPPPLPGPEPDMSLANSMMASKKLSLKL